MNRDQKSFSTYSLVLGVLGAIALGILVLAIKLSGDTQGEYARDGEEYQAAVAALGDGAVRDFRIVEGVDQTLGTFLHIDHEAIDTGHEVVVEDVDRNRDRETGDRILEVVEKRSARYTP